MRRSVLTIATRLTPLYLFFAGVAFAALLVFFVIPGLMITPDDIADSAKRFDAQNAIRTTGLQALGAIVVAVGVVYTSKTFALNREGQLTDRFTKAVDQLGATDRREVQLGGIYALERIARSSALDHGPVIEVLNAFVRDHTRYLGELHTDDRCEEFAGDHSSAIRFDAVAELPTPVSAAITVLGRRTRSHDTEVVVDLRGIDLGGLALPDFDLGAVNLSGAYLRATDLRGAHLHDCELTGVHLEQSDLRRCAFSRSTMRWSHLAGCSLYLSEFDDANLSFVHLQGCNASIHVDKDANDIQQNTRVSFRRAILDGAVLDRGQLRGAVFDDAFMRRASCIHTLLDRASFRRARLWHADFTNARLRECDLAESELYGADLSSTDLREVVLGGAVFDDQTKWPAGFDPEAVGAVRGSFSTRRPGYI